MSVEAVAEQGGAAQVAGVAHRPLQGLGLGEQDDQPPGAGDGGIEQVAAQHATVLAQQRQHDGRVLRALRLVDGDRVGDGQAVQLVGGIGEPAAVHGDLERLRPLVDGGDPADIAVVDLAVVVVLELHHLVAQRQAALAAGEHQRRVRVEVRLQQLVERLGAAPAAIDRRQHLDVVDRVEAEPLGDAVEDQVEQLGLRRPRGR